MKQRTIQKTERKIDDTHSIISNFYLDKIIDIYDRYKDEPDELIKQLTINSIECSIRGSVQVHFKPKNTKETISILNNKIKELGGNEYVLSAELPELLIVLPTEEK